MKARDILGRISGKSLPLPLITQWYVTIISEFGWVDFDKFKKMPPSVIFSLIKIVNKRNKIRNKKR
jgi:hypothetical protein